VITEKIAHRINTAASALAELFTLELSRGENDFHRRGRKMRSETDQMTGGREESVVEIQFRDIPRGQDAVFVNSKQKEEKKEVFTKVGRALMVCLLLLSIADMRSKIISTTDSEREKDA
jgi:hypothetical protein